jgi:predicted permease
LYKRLQDAFTRLPGVAAAALCSYSPQSGGSWNDGVFVDGHGAPGAKEDISSSFSRVTPGFFEAIGNPIVRGRAILEQDTDSAQHVAVINEAFARRFFKNEDPIGKHFGRSQLESARMYEVVGVAKDAEYLTYTLGQPPRPFFFLPEVQHDVFPNPQLTKGDIRAHFLYDIVIATKPGVHLSVEEVKKTIASVDPNMPVNSIHTMREQVAEQFVQQRLIARLSSFFGILSLVLASIGLYGVTAYNAGRRMTEIGVRMALGANRGQVVTLVLRGALGLIGFGLLLGIPLSLAVGNLLRNQLYGTNPYDPAITIVAIAVLGLSAMAAAFLPAFRASLISPVQLLRAE